MDVCRIRKKICRHKNSRIVHRMNRPAVLLIYDRTTLRRIWMISQAFCSNRSSLVFCAHLAVMMEYPWPFHKLICTEQEVNPQYRKLQDKGRKNPRNTAYHINGIADQSNFVSPPARNTPAIRAVFCRTHNIIGIDKQHVLQIMHCPVT